MNDVKHPIQCICPQCGYVLPKRQGKTCTNMNRPICKINLINK